MTEKIDIAEILKDKPANTKLYSPLFGEVYFSHVGGGNIAVEHHGGISLFFSSGRFFDYDESEPLLFPSKEMRDWRKFAWKKGDVLVSNDGKLEVIFEKFGSDTYQSFIGKHHLDSLDENLYYQDGGAYPTASFNIETEDAAQTYIKTIEEKLDGKLNRETLEIEKAQPEFKDGDIVHDVHGYNTYIIKEFSNKHIKIYAGLTNQYGAIPHKIGMSEIFHLRFATEEEKQQLFDALAKEGKAWNAEKKQIVDLKPKCEFKPMDLCLMKYIGQYNNRGWELCQYAYTEHRVSSIGEQRDFYHAVGGEIYAECIPYKGNEHLLGTKKSK